MDDCLRKIIYVIQSFILFRISSAIIVHSTARPDNLLIDQGVLLDRKQVWLHTAEQVDGLSDGSFRSK
jgi:hypothetical protein